MGSQERLPSNANNSLQRVKVYRLNDEGKWDDQGTGHVTVDYLERSEDLGLYVLDEEDNETLLLHRITSEDIYRKQEDTIISWRDPEYATELALSFQETTRCSYIWDQIANVQRNIHFNSLNNQACHSINNELRELPPVELSTLPLLHKTITESGIGDQLRVAELVLHDQDFVRRLMDLFRICEDMENIDGLHMIFKIVHGIVLLNSSKIFEKIFGDELIMDIIGCLEYDPEGPHVHHRYFLKEHVVFKEAIPIKDPLVLSKIHQTYKLGYLKDVILPRALDEATVANLNSIIHSNNAIVISLLKEDSTFIEELFSKLTSPNTPAESKRNLVHFLHEFCSLGKNLQMTQQLRLYRDLVREGIFDVICDVLQSQDRKLVLTGTDILILFLNQDRNLLWCYASRPEGLPLIGLMVKGMLTDFGDDMHWQFLEILRGLLDPYLMGSQRDEIVEIFYEKHLGQLIDVITSSCPPNGASQTVIKSLSSGGESGYHSSVKPEILLNICELLAFCVLHHPYRTKCNFLLNNVIDKVLFLTRRREKYLVLAAVRFMRTLISRNDEHLMNHIVKHNLLKSIVDAFVANGGRYNLLDSSILELFEYIRKENLKVLLRYLVDTYWNQLIQFKNLPSIHLLKIKYEQSLESSETRTGTAAIDPRKRTEERALEKEEEDYFNEDSDEEDSASASSHTRMKRSQATLHNGTAASNPSLRPCRLVDYDNDEEDENYKPPHKKQLDIDDKDVGVVESVQLKRKLTAEEGADRKRLRKSSKPKNSLVFNTLCATLSRAVLPCKKTMSSSHTFSSSDSNRESIDANHKESLSGAEQGRSSVVENHSDRKDSPQASPINFSDSLQNYSDRVQQGDDNLLISPKSPAEMTVNGS